MTESDIEDIAERAAEKAVTSAFRHMGVNMADQSSLNSFRSDLVHAHKMRRFSESTTNKAWLVLLGAFTIGVLTLLWDGLKAAIGGGK